MPTYEYECKHCGHSFEVFQSMSDEPLKNCTECGKEVRRLIFGGAGVIFKGSGFYVTDKSADKNKKPGNKDTAKTEVQTAKTSSTSKDSSDKKTADTGTKPAAPASTETATT